MGPSSGDGGVRRLGLNTFLGRLFTPCSHCDMLVMTAALPSSQVIMKIREKDPDSTLHPVELLRWEERE